MCAYTVEGLYANEHIFYLTLFFRVRAFTIYSFSNLKYIIHCHLLQLAFCIGLPMQCCSEQLRYGSNSSAIKSGMNTEIWNMYKLG